MSNYIYYRLVLLSMILKFPVRHHLLLSLVNKFDFFSYKTSLKNKINKKIISALDTENKSNIIHIFFENHLISSNTSSLPEALKYVMAVHYVFNIKYVKQISLSMEFFQRYLLQLTHSLVRGNKTHKNAIGRVENFI